MPNHPSVSDFELPDTVELTPPDISPYRQGNAGIEYVYRFESGQPGVNVLITALVHGNELCGAIALDALLKQQVRPMRGTLTLAFVNVAAYEQFDPSNPRASRYVDEDFNRLWSDEVLNSSRTSVELCRARELRPIVAAADVLLDLHSMHYLSKPLVLAGTAPQGRSLAQQLGIPGVIVLDAGHRAGVRMRDYGEFANPHSSKAALLVECGQHWQTDSATLAIDLCWRFLHRFDLIDPDLATAHMTSQPPQITIEVTDAVTVQTNCFHFAQPYVGLEVIPQAGTLIGYDGDRSVTTPYDDCVLIMPTYHLQPGSTAVRLGRLLT